MTYLAPRAQLPNPPPCQVSFNDLYIFRHQGGAGGSNAPAPSPIVNLPSMDPVTRGHKSTWPMDLPIQHRAIHLASAIWSAVRPSIKNSSSQVPQWQVTGWARTIVGISARIGAPPGSVSPIVMENMLANALHLLCPLSEVQPQHWNPEQQQPHDWAQYRSPCVVYKNIRGKGSGRVQGMTKHRDGYLMVSLGKRPVTRDGKQQWVTVKETGPRLVLWMAAGPPANEAAGRCIHLCENPRCLNPLHLAWGSASENMRGDFTSFAAAWDRMAQVEAACRRASPPLELMM